MDTVSAIVRDIWSNPKLFGAAVFGMVSLYVAMFYELITPPSQKKMVTLIANLTADNKSLKKEIEVMEDKISSLEKELAKTNQLIVSSLEARSVE